MAAAEERGIFFFFLSYGEFYYLQYEALFLRRKGWSGMRKGTHDNNYTCRELCTLKITSFQSTGVNEHLFAPLKYWQGRPHLITIY